MGSTSMYMVCGSVLWDSTYLLSNSIDVILLAAVADVSTSGLPFGFDLLCHSFVTIFIDVPEHYTCPPFSKPTKAT